MKRTLAKRSSEHADADGAMAELSAAQRGAIERLAAGATPAAAAEAVGVGRTTVYRWLKSDPDFAAAYHAWQAESVAIARDRMLALADAAVTTVAAAVDKGDARIALAVLKGQGLLSPPAPGPTDPALIARQARAAEAKAQEAMLIAEETCPAATSAVSGSFNPYDLAQLEAAPPKLLEDLSPALPGHAE